MTRIIAIMVVLAVSACSRTEPQLSEADQAPAALPAGMTRIADASQVCMVNDQFMGRAQIPVVVDGRTYYGCCAQCKDKLANQSAARLARDPVTGEFVDKAQAVIVQDASGKVLYFASEATLRRFRG
jgi:YHS domain-containing protein